MPPARGRSPDIEYHFTDDAKVAILQARHEALHTRARMVGPPHLALGVMHTQPQWRLDLLFPDRGNFETLCRTLGGSNAPAPVIPEDIGYLEAAVAVLNGAAKIAAEAAGGPATLPLHILMGMFRPWDVDRNQVGAPDQSALALAATGLSETRLRELLPVFLGHPT
jgi:hypothetical protein